MKHADRHSGYCQHADEVLHGDESEQVICVASVSVAKCVYMHGCAWDRVFGAMDMKTLRVLRFLPNTR